MIMSWISLLTIINVLFSEYVVKFLPCMRGHGDMVLRKKKKKQQ